MIRSELVQKLCTDFPDLTQREVESVVSAIFDSITDQLAKGGRVELDEERRATLVGNLLVVLCSHENPQPVLNTGSLYT
jgi:hypothetical protein